MTKDEPAGKNPPDGAIIDYYLPANAKGEVTLEIMDTTGDIIRRYSSKDSMYKIPEVNIPLYWVRPQQILSADSGSHRFLWDMHYTPLNVPPSYPIGAVVGETAPAPSSPWAMPGIYKVKLSVNGKTYVQSFSIIMDPRVETSESALQQQHDLSQLCYNNELKVMSALKEIRLLKKSHQEPGDSTIVKKLSSFERSPIPGDINNFSSLDGRLRSLVDAIQGVDAMPTAQCIADVKEADAAFTQLWQKWSDFKKGLPQKKK